MKLTNVALTSSAGVLVAVVAVLFTACQTSMVITIHNQGPALEARALCGDQAFDQQLATGAQVTWEPTANVCRISTAKVDPVAVRYQLNITCKHSHACSFDAGFGDDLQLMPEQTKTADVAGTVVTWR